jgi:hypothetical protein
MVVGKRGDVVQNGENGDGDDNDDDDDDDEGDVEEDPPCVLLP